MRLAAYVLGFVLSSTSVHAAELYGRVVGVTDGDTITLLDSANAQHDIRLFAIDSPETSCHHKRPSPQAEQCVEHGQEFGKTAKRSLSELVYGRDVRVELKPGNSYGRKIGTVWVGATDANLMQVARGMAWHYRKYAERGQGPVEFAQYARAEQGARSSGSGLWADSNPVAPWDYRNAVRQ